MGLSAPHRGADVADGHGGLQFVHGAGNVADGPVEHPEVHPPRSYRDLAVEELRGLGVEASQQRRDGGPTHTRRRPGRRGDIGEVRIGDVDVSEQPTRLGRPPEHGETHRA